MGKTVHNIELSEQKSDSKSANNVTAGPREHPRKCHSYGNILTFLNMHELILLQKS